MRTLVYVSLICCSPLFGYTHTIKLDQAIKRIPGTYEIILDNRADTSFRLTIDSNQNIKITSQRGVEITTTRDSIEISPDEASACLKKVTVNDTAKNIASASIATKPFRQSVAGPSYCGNYTFKLTIDAQNTNLKLKDKTDFQKND